MNYLSFRINLLHILALAVGVVNLNKLQSSINNYNHLVNIVFGLDCKWNLLYGFKGLTLKFVILQADRSLVC